MDFEVTDFTVEGKCSNCGKCCSNALPLSAGEVKTIKKYIKKHNIKEQRHNYRVGTDMTCPFRDEVNRKCLIYDVRPQICKQFVCNHTIEDIQKSKLDLHRINRVVFMRNEFFGNPEDVNWFSSVLKAGIMLYE
jgi:hypothetical protein